MQIRDHEAWVKEVDWTEGLSEKSHLNITLAERWATEMEAGFAKGMSLKTGALHALEVTLPLGKHEYSTDQLVKFLAYTRRVLGECWAYGDRFAAWYEGRGFEEGFAKRAFENILEWQSQ